MQSTPVGDTLLLVVRLHADAEGRWHIDVDGTHTYTSVPLVPATLILHVWRTGDQHLLRGNVELYGSEHSAALQSSDKLVDLLRAWLIREPAPSAGEEG